MADAARKLKRNLESMFRVRETLAAGSRDFHIHYRNWCLEESEAECARDFRLVRMVQDTSTSIFLNLVEPLTHDERKDLAIALCKSMNWPESLSKSEAEINSRYRQHWSMPLNVNGTVLSALRTTPHQLELQEKFLRSNPSPRTIAHSLRKALKGVAGTDFGRILQDRPTLLLYEKKVGAWYVITAFELLARPQLRYAHHIHALSGGSGETKIYGGISVLNWTGIHPDSTWSWLLPEDIPKVAGRIHRICNHFLGQASGLLRDLKNPT
jgi:hypothetical protein